jgi:hypothetical protein
VAGKKGRSGRPKGALSWPGNPAALAGQHLNGFIEQWLAVVPNERRYTVPLQAKLFLARAAIAHVMRLHPEMRPPQIHAVLYWSRRRAPAGTLRHTKAGGDDIYSAYSREISEMWRKAESETD